MPNTVSVIGIFFYAYYASRLSAFNGNCGMGQAGAGGETWYGDRASPTGGSIENAGNLTVERSQRAKQGICRVHLQRGQW